MQMSASWERRPWTSSSASCHFSMFLGMSSQLWRRQACRSATQSLPRLSGGLFSFCAYGHIKILGVLARTYDIRGHNCIDSLPCLCRPLLKQMMKTGDGISSLNPTEAAELLQFCFQDVYSLTKELGLPPPDAEGQQPLPQADAAGQPLFCDLACSFEINWCQKGLA